MAKKKTDPVSTVKAPFAPVTLLLGEDAVSKETFLEQWIAKWTTEESKSFNLDILQGGETPVEDIINSALALPMMAEHRTVIVRHAEKINAAGALTLSEYAANPSPSTALILEAEEIDARLKGWKAISKEAEVIPCKKPYADQIPSWVVERCRKQYGRKIEPAAAGLLCDCVGENLFEIDSELNKLDIGLDKNAAIRVENVEVAVGARAENIFKWIQAMGERESGKALMLLDRVLEMDDNVLRPLSLLARHLFTLLKIRLLQKKRMGEEEIAAKLGMNHFYFFKKQGFARQAAGFTIEELKLRLFRLSETDKAAKSTTLESKLVLSALVLEVCG